MKNRAYWQLLDMWNDSSEPGVRLRFKGGSIAMGIARNASYAETLPEGLAWLSTRNQGDIVVSISDIVMIERWKGDHT